MGYRALMLINPVAHSLPRREALATAADWLRGQGWQVDRIHTRYAGHATELARDAVTRGYHTVIACGGDGTINDVVNGLAGSETWLSVIPGGTANVWAKEVGIPKDPLKAVQTIVHGVRRRIDLGQAKDRYFLLMAGLGLDGYVINAIPPALKESLGAVAYVWTSIWAGSRYRARPARITIDDEILDVSLLFMVAGNIRNYGGVVEITKQALADDGLLDVCIFSGQTVLGSLGHIVRVFTGSHLKAPGIIYRRGRRIGVETKEPCFVQVDGDLFTTTPTTIEAKPSALTVNLPPGRGQHLFRSLLSMDEATP